MRTLRRPVAVRDHRIARVEGGRPPMRERRSPLSPPGWTGRSRTAGCAARPPGPIPGSRPVEGMGGERPTGGATSGRASDQVRRPAERTGPPQIRARARCSSSNGSFARDGVRGRRGREGIGKGFVDAGPCAGGPMGSVGRAGSRDGHGARQRSGRGVAQEREVALHVRDGPQERLGPTRLVGLHGHRPPVDEHDHRRAPDRRVVAADPREGRSEVDPALLVDPLGDPGLRLCRTPPSPHAARQPAVRPRSPRRAPHDHVVVTPVPSILAPRQLTTPVARPVSLCASGAGGAPCGQEGTVTSTGRGTARRGGAAGRPGGDTAPLESTHHQRGAGRSTMRMIGGG
jgi:hypothetical protein